MSWAVTAVAAIAVGTTVVQQDSARKAAHKQEDALRDQKAADAADAAKAESDATNSANQMVASQKRAQRLNMLNLGGDDSPLGSTKSVLSAGAPGAQRAAAVAPTTSVLGGGSPALSTRAAYS